MTGQEQAIVAVQLRFFFIAAIFGVCAYTLSGGIGRALLLFVTVLACLILNFARRWLDRGALIVLAVTFLVIFDIIPPPAAWRDSFQNVIVATCHPSDVAK